MPVVPAMVAIGTAMGASAGAAAAVGTIATVSTVASVAGQAVGMYKTNQANKASAKLATTTAQYNADLDNAEADQIILDADANTAAARREAAVYVSRQQTAYAASGVLSSGTPLAAEVTTAARLEQGIQQDRSNALREATKRQEAARAGILYGAATADGIRRQNNIDMLKGGIGILSSASSLYQSGAFSLSHG